MLDSVELDGNVATGNNGNSARGGGLHATGLFNADGELRCVREDVGRHNAMDKVIGWAFGEGVLPLARGVLCVSGRL